MAEQPIVKFDDNNKNDAIYTASEKFKNNNTFSGCDISAMMSYVPFKSEAQFSSKPQFQKMADIQTISISSFREKVPVRALGYNGPKTFVRGSRTIAGTIIFTMFNKDVFYDVMQLKKGDANFDAKDPLGFRYITLDQIPPFNILISYVNEYGFASGQIIYGVEIHSTGQIMSVEDLFMEKTVQYVARDVSLLTPVVDQSEYESLKKYAVREKVNGKITFDSLLGNNNAQAILTKLNNPFV